MELFKALGEQVGEHVSDREEAREHFNHIFRACRPFIQAECNEIAANMRSIKRQQIRIRAQSLKQRTEEMRVVPISQVHYTQDTISSTFSSGEHPGLSIDYVVDGLLNGNIDVTNKFLILDVVEYRGRLYSLNNRRLWCLKEYAQRKLEQREEHQARLSKLREQHEAKLKANLEAKLRNITHFSKVKVVGLTSERSVHLNGHVGVATVLLPTGRWRVEIDGEAEPRALMAENLRLCGLEEPTSPDASEHGESMIAHLPDASEHGESMIAQVWPLIPGLHLSSGPEVVGAFLNRHNTENGGTAVKVLGRDSEGRHSRRNWDEKLGHMIQKAARGKDAHIHLRTCKFFSGGVCKHGSVCRYSHD